MTDTYDRLCEGPQTGISRGALSNAERTELRVLRVGRSSDLPPEYNGQFVSVYYLAGQVRAAARKFVDVNREQLEAIDYANPDPIQSALDRDAYDWVLHFLGERELRKYRTVVYERRRDGTEWIMERELFENDSDRRYSVDARAAKISPEIAAADLYEEFDGQISRWELDDHEAVEGAGKQILEYYRVAGAFDCVPAETKGGGRNPVLEKR